MIDNTISAKHPIYNALASSRAAFAAVKGGTDAMHVAAETYLPKYPAEGSDYTGRLNAATIDGIVSGGVEALTGAVFEGEIDITKVNPAIKPILENIDNCGNHFNVFVRDAFDASFDGCAVILVDMPAETEETAAIRQQFGAEADKMLNKRPYWILYRAVEAINWRYRENPKTKKMELALLVVKLLREVPDGKYGTTSEIHYRSWMLSETGQVEWEHWVEKTTNNIGNGPAEFVNGGVIKGVSRIPAAIIGKLNDEPKLLTETRLEIKAYQKESSFDTIEYLSVPTFYTKGYDGTEPLKLGAATHLKLPLEGEVGFAQIDADGHDSLKGTIREIKDYIKARLNYVIQQPMGDKTATESVIEDKDKQARLVVWAEQLKDAVELALGFTAEYMGKGIDQGGEVVFNTKWMIDEQKRIESEARKAEADSANIELTRAKANQ